MSSGGYGQAVAPDSCIPPSGRIGSYSCKSCYSNDTTEIHVIGVQSAGFKMTFLGATGIAGHTSTVSGLYCIVHFIEYSSKCPVSEISGKTE